MEGLCPACGEDTTFETVGFGAEDGKTLECVSCGAQMSPFDIKHAKPENVSHGIAAGVDPPLGDDPW